MKTTFLIILIALSYSFAFGGLHSSTINIVDDDEFIEVEKEVSFDYSRLQKSVEYPDLALKAGIQGTVIVKVYINRNGNPTKSSIISSDNKLLEKSAIDAIMNFKEYKPAIVKGEPVGCWISIPIKYRLTTAGFKVVVLEEKIKLFETNIFEGYLYRKINKYTELGYGKSATLELIVKNGKAIKAKVLQSEMSNINTLLKAIYEYDGFLVKNEEEKVRIMITLN